MEVGGDNNHAVFGQKFLHRQYRLSRSTVVAKKPISSAPIHRTFPSHMFS